MVAEGIIDPVKGYEKRTAECDIGCFYTADDRGRSSGSSGSGTG